MSRSARGLVFLLLLCSVVFWWRLGKLGLIDPDEPFYAQTAREMVQTGDWITPRIFGLPQFEKPILFYWLTAASFKAFGETEFAARLPSALPATILVVVVYLFGSRFAGRRAGLLSAVVLATGLEYAIMSRLMLTDIALALFIAGALFSYWLALEDASKRGRYLVLHFVCAGLAVLTKGPLASLVCMMAIGSYGWFRRRHAFSGAAPAVWTGLALYALITVPWYAVMLVKYGREYFDSFFIHENIMRLLRAEHPANNHWYYYIAILLLGSIPWMPPLALAIKRAIRRFQGDQRITFLWCWILTSLIFLTIAQSKLPSYIFYVFVPLALAVGIELDELISYGFRTAQNRRLAIGLAIFQCVVALAAPFIKVAKPFAAPALAMAACCLLGVIFLWRQRWIEAIAAHALATVALVCGALFFSVDHVEEYSSARPVAEAMMNGNPAPSGAAEPLIAGKFLARGIHYYTHQPVSVLANKRQPFWTPHPLPVIAGRDALSQFVKDHGAVRVTIRKSEWPFWKKSNLIAAAGEPQWFGDNAVIRLVAPIENAASTTKAQRTHGD